MASFLTNPISGAETALAADANFLTWCGASDATDAKANYIFAYDAIDGSIAPQKYAALSALVGWDFQRDAENSGQAAFQLTGAMFHMVFSEVFTNQTDDWGDTVRIAFEDNVAGFLTAFLGNYEENGYRIFRLTQIDFGDDFTVRYKDPDTGKKGYQYGVTAEVGAIG